MAKRIMIPGGNKKDYDLVRTTLNNRKINFNQLPPRWHWQNPSYVIFVADRDFLKTRKIFDELKMGLL